MKILLVEDHDAIRELTCAHLTGRGFVVDTARSVEEALAALDTAAYDAIVVDLGLPDGDGSEVLAHRERTRLRDEGPTPALILTARDSVEDLVSGLNGGADDYVTKPFRLEELEARLRAVLRRPGPRIDRELVAGDLGFNTVSRELRVRGVVQSLGRRETLLLEVLLMARGRLVVRDVLTDRLYGAEEAVTPNALEMAVSRLRRSLREAGSTMEITTQRGVGYRLAAA